jgi:hypothetical protein
LLDFWFELTGCRYWQFLLYLFITLTALELVLSPMPSVYSAYSALIGYIGLSVEATLPIPQIISNYKSKSCKGFRLSVLINWLAGDAMKMFWFFSATTDIPWAFKLCGIFQMCCDSFLGIQAFVLYGEGPPAVIKDHKMSGMNGFSHNSNVRARTPMTEKDVRLGDWYDRCSR